MNTIEELDIITRMRGEVMSHKDVTGENLFLAWGYPTVLVLLAEFAALMIWNEDWCAWLWVGIPLIGAALQIYGAGVPGKLTISGGTFIASGTGSGSQNKGILVEEGNGEGTASIMISSGTVIASGGHDDDTNAGADAIDVQGTLTISGGAIVTADGGTSTYDNGGGYGISVREGNSAGGSATISGGVLTATGGDQMPAINVDKNLTISGGTTVITATGGAKDGSGANGLGVDDNSTISVGTGITFFEGDAANPTTEGTPPTCTKRYVVIK